MKQNGESCLLSDDSLHEVVDKFVVLGTLNALVSCSDVEWVVKELFIVSPYIQHHRKTPGRLDARESNVERQLADRNAHTVCTQVAKSKNSFPVRHDDSLINVQMHCAASSI